MCPSQFANVHYQDLYCAPGRIRTCDARFRKPMLYPLSYEGGVPSLEAAGNDGL